MSFRSQDQIMLYSYCVSSNLSFFVGVVFLNDSILIDKQYVERLEEVLDDLGIYPVNRTDKPGFVFNH